MKEAIGELNMTVIIVIIVAVLVAFFSMVIWPTLNSDLKHNAGCSDAVCENCAANDTRCKCKLPDNTDIYCANRS